MRYSVFVYAVVGNSALSRRNYAVQKLPRMWGTRRYPQDMALRARIMSADIRPGRVTLYGKYGARCAINTAVSVLWVIPTMPACYQLIKTLGG